MKQTKFLFPLLMAIVMMAMSPARAWAEEEYPVITGGTHTIDIAAYRDGYTEFSHYTTIFKYVAPNGGTLTVYTEGEGDTASALFDEDKTTLAYDDDSGNSRNFKFSYKVVKDHTYYIGVCSSEDFTNYTLVIDESDLCDHEIVNHVCTICGKHQSRIVSVPAGVTVTDDDGNPITSEDYIWEGRTVNISVNASEVTAPIYIGLDATTAEGSRLNIRRNNSFVMPGSDVTLNYMAIPSEPLCFEAKEDGAKIGFSSIVSDYILYYSTDKENWTSFNYDDTHYLPTLANAGDKIYLIGNVTSSSEWSYTQVKIEDANVAASGKLSSILGGATIIYDFGCYKMFYYNGNLISAPDMSDITEIGKCGCDEMFRGCSALTTAPAMSSLTAIGNLGCDGMFYVCSALTTAPAMSSLTTIGDEGCYQMFGDCSALTTAPAMSSLTAIGNLGCDGMFSHCPQLTGFEFNTVPYVVESGFYDFGTDNITLNLSDDSYVYKEGENPGFPTVTSVTAPCTLNLTGSVVENHANLTLNHGTAIDDEEVAATCTTTGLTEGSHCSLCNMPFVAQVEIEALGHDYHVQQDENEKPVFVWSEGYTTATLQVVCSHDAEHTANVEVTGEGITSEDTTPATCITTGVRTYTAKATYEGEEYTGTKEEKIPQIPHDFTSHTLTDGPVTSGLYAYTCDYGCWHYDEHRFIKDFYGEGNHLELTEDGAGNYSTSEDIILADANGFAAPIDFIANSVTYTRTGIKNQWGTIVVPFDVNGIGADYDLYKLNQVLDNHEQLVLTKIDEDDNDGIVPAGTPVIFRLHDDLAGDYTLTLTAANTTVSCWLEEGSDADGLQLVGTYDTIRLNNEYDYYISKNMFWMVGDVWAEGVKVAPFRAYLKNTWAMAKAHTLSIRIADEDVTAVDALNAIIEGNAEYYDTNGRRTNSLQKGVNIVKYGNGKTLKVNIK
ncbi:MAG: leucine-rich repeat protein [Prevotella sp.]|nr:leucine-rich repeat protein [Candidatus Prevotella equi]